MNFELVKFNHLCIHLFPTKPSVSLNLWGSSTGFASVGTRSLVPIRMPSTPVRSHVVPGAPETHFKGVRHFDALLPKAKELVSHCEHHEGDGGEGTVSTFVVRTCLNLLARFSCLLCLEVLVLVHHRINNLMNLNWSQLGTLSCLLEYYLVHRMLIVCFPIIWSARFSSMLCSEVLVLVHYRINNLMNLVAIWNFLLHAYLNTYLVHDRMLIVWFPIIWSQIPVTVAPSY